MLLAFLGWYWEGAAGAAPPAPTPAVGGGSAKRPRRRYYVIGDRHVVVDDRTELEAVIAALAAEDVEIAPAREVRAKPAVPAEAIAPVSAPIEPMRVDWDSLNAILRQSVRLAQPEVVSVVRAILRRIDDDEDDIEALLLS